MAQYSKATDANGTTRYKDGNKFVKADDVPENVKTVLGDAADGTVVDELGDPVNPETDTDEGTSDESAPGPDDSADDESDADEDEQDVPPSPDRPAEQTAPAKPRKPAPARQTQVETPPVEQDEEGMGFKRSKGKTLSVFSNKPHETVRNYNGIMVPMTHEEYETKTDAEVGAKLRELGKI